MTLLAPARGVRAHARADTEPGVFLYQML
jgi:hypothetical protein